jgi:hypothetical protein
MTTDLSELWSFHWDNVKENWTKFYGVVHGHICRRSLCCGELKSDRCCGKSKIMKFGKIARVQI